MVRLNEKEQDWLRENYPELVYNPDKNEIVGPISFRLQYDGCPALTGTYSIRIDLASGDRGLNLPEVYNPDGKIVKIAHRKGIPTADMHVYDNNRLCLILPYKTKDYYPNGFELPKLISHICNHLYWVKHFDRYGKAPWPGEQHGELFAYLENHFELRSKGVKLTKDEPLLKLRLLYRGLYKKGIALSSLDRKLRDRRFVFNFLTRIYHELSTL